MTAIVAAAVLMVAQVEEAAKPKLNRLGLTDTETLTATAVVSGVAGLVIGFESAGGNARPEPVPEPATVAVLSVGFVSLLRRRRR